MLKVVEPAFFGVPLSNPAVDRVRPAGRFVAEYVYLPVPPATLNRNE
jgi:hypothetical protein